MPEPQKGFARKGTGLTSYNNVVEMIEKYDDIVITPLAESVDEEFQRVHRALAAQGEMLVEHHRKHQALSALWTVRFERWLRRLLQRIRPYRQGKEA